MSYDPDNWFDADWLDLEYGVHIAVDENGALVNPTHAALYALMVSNNVWAQYLNATILNSRRRRRLRNWRRWHWGRILVWLWLVTLVALVISGWVRGW